MKAAVTKNKLFFLILSQSDVRNEFDFARLIRIANKIARAKNWARRSIFVELCRSAYFFTLNKYFWNKN